MDRVILIYDRLNKMWLQNSEEPGVQWTEEETQCSFYQEDELPELLNKIKRVANGEVWVEVKPIYVNL